MALRRVSFRTPEEARIAIRDAVRRIVVYEISTGSRTGRDAFFDAVRSSMPLNPPVVSSRSWEALSDSLWEGLSAVQGDEILIVWADADEFSRANRLDFDQAITLLSEVSELLGDQRATLGNPKHITVIVGTG